MAAKAKSCLENGYNTMSITCGDYKYFYRLWFEDVDSKNIIGIKTSLKSIFQKMKSQYVPFSRDWYRNIQTFLFPNKKVVCYEFYSIHLSGVDACAIAQCADELPKLVKRDVSF